MTNSLTHDQIIYILNRESVARIGCSLGNETYIVPLSYTFDGKFIYGRSREGKKIHMMRNNPNVCVEIDNIEHMANWQCVIVQGKYEEVTSAVEQSKVLKIITDKFMPLTTSKTLALHGIHVSNGAVEREKNTIIFRISILSMSGRYEKLA